MVAIGWHGPAYEIAGYGEVARNILPLLEKLGVKIHLKTETWGQPAIALPEIQRMRKPIPFSLIHIRHSVAGVFQPTGRYNIGYTVYETTHLPRSWAKRCNLMHEIWTASHFCRDSFVRSGVRKPILVMPHGVDTKRFNPSIRGVTIANRKKFVFLSVMSGTYLRKGVDLLIRAYSSEFSSKEDVCLVIKILKDYPQSKFLIARYTPTRKDSPKILLMANPVSPNKLPQLYRSAQCFVSPSRGEGWDLPCSEAMSSEIPVIATGWGGHLEFMNDSNSYLINVARMVAPSQGIAKSYTNYMRWAEPDISHLRQLMRHVFENPTEAKEKAIRARNDIVEKFQWRHSAKKIFDRLNQLG